MADERKVVEAVYAGSIVESLNLLSPYLIFIGSEIMFSPFDWLPLTPTERISCKRVSVDVP